MLDVLLLEVLLVLLRELLLLLGGLASVRVETAGVG